MILATAACRCKDHLHRYLTKMSRLLITTTTLLVNILIVQAQQLFTVVIDPGHGGKDPGSVGAIVYEKNINLAVALLFGNLIEQHHKDVKVVYTRKTDVFIPLDERANIANRNKAHVFISIHTNSVRKNYITGAETYTLGLNRTEENLEVAMRENAVITMEDDYLQKYEGFDPSSTESYIIFELMQNKHLEQSVLLASEIQQSFVRINRDNRDVRQGGFLVLRKTSMPSVLIELGFLSNNVEEQFLVSKEGQGKLAQSIYEAFTNYKNVFDRKGGLAGNTADTVGLPPNPTAEIIDSSKRQDEIIYKVQILTAGRLLSPKDKRFKGYTNISYYVEKGVYKYTVGATSDYPTILKMYRKASKDFKGAFIIKTINGKRVIQ